MTWKELKDFCNSVEDRFLDKKVILWREDESINNISCRFLEEDYYIDDDLDEEGCYPESEAVLKIKDDIEIYSNGLSDLKNVTKNYTQY